jgi:serine/threonine protein kinase
LLGQIPEPGAVALEQHLAGCLQCSETLHTLGTDDPFVEAMRAQAPGGPKPAAAVIESLVERLAGLQSAVAAAFTEFTAEGQAEPTQETAETTQELYDFLAPPRGPGEIGWLGPYRVLSVLGVGGMGVVFQAEDPQLKRSVALKTLKPALAASPSARRRFLSEAQAAAAIEHDHIVAIYQVGEDRGMAFLAMPLLQGETLDERIMRERKLPVVEVLRIGREVAEGLAAAHQRGLIHRDVKPANIWLEGERGRVKIVDFGLARAMGGEAMPAPSPTQAEATAGPGTHHGTVLGTPAYIAPEQARGEVLDGRCDLFSLGCVLYRMCTGEAPFKGMDTLATLRAVQKETPRPVRELNPAVSPALAELVQKLLAKRREDRYPSAQAVAAELQKIADDCRRRVPRVRRRVLAAGLLLVALLGVAGYLFGPGLLGLDAERQSSSDGTPPGKGRASPRPCRFAPQVAYPVGTSPYTVVAGDFNGDGKLDLAVSNIGSNDVSVLLGNGDGSFGKAVSYPAGHTPHGIVAVDLEGDGKLDLVVANLDDGTVSVLRGRGDGSFGKPRSYPAGKGARGVAAGDFNGDGKLDLAVANHYAHTVSVLLGKGDGSFAAPVTYGAGDTPVSVAVADFNRDGVPDLVISCGGADVVAVLLGKGDGTFGKAIHYAVGSGPGAVGVGDFNGDGSLDLAVENFGSHDVCVLLGDGDGTFRSAVNYPAGLGPGGLVVADFNGDGVADLAMANHDGYNLSLLLGNGDGTFRVAEPCAAGSTPAGVTAADFNGDGRIDLAVVNHKANTISVLLNQPPAPHFRLAVPRHYEAGHGILVTAAAMDEWDRPDPSFSGEVRVASSDPRAVASKSPSPGAGMAALLMTFQTAGAHAVTVADAATGKRVGSITVPVAPAAPASFRVAAPDRVVAGKPFTITVTVLDRFGNTATDFTGAVHFRSSDDQAELPDNYSFREEDVGIHTFPVTCRTIGKQTLTVTCPTAQALIGTAEITVTAVGGRGYR